MPADQFLTHQTPLSIRALPWLPMAILAAYGLVLTLPALMPGFFVAVDFSQHVIWAKHFSHALWHGDLYPRWALEMNAGLGSPFFFHYGPVAYYITSMFTPLLSHDPEGWRQVALSAALALVASGFSTYLWLSRLTGRNGALIGALVYMGEPYHLMMFYHIMGLATLWALVWLPLIMMAVEDVARGRRHATLRLAFLYALLLMSHLPVALVFSLLPVAYGFIAAPANIRLRRLATVIGALVLGTALSAVFLIPAMTTQGNVWFMTLNEGIFTYDQNFILKGLQLNDRPATPWQIGAAEITMTFAALCAWFAVRATTNVALRPTGNILAVAAASALIMMTPVAAPIWALIPPLQQLQFPWRFAPLITLACSALAAILLCASGKKHTIAILFPVALLLGAILGLSLPVVAEAGAMARALEYVTVDHLKQVLGKRSDEWMMELDRIQSDADTIEHLPIWVPRTPFVDREVGYLATAKLSRETPRASVVAGKGTIDVQRWGADGIALDVHGVSPVKIVIGQFYYPGWSARLGDSGTELACGPSKPYGLLQCDVPAGNHSVTVIRTHTKPESVGIAISTLSLLIAAAVWLTGRRRATGEPARMGHIPVVPVEVTETQK